MGEPNNEQIPCVSFDLKICIPIDDLKNIKKAKGTTNKTFKYYNKLLLSAIKSIELPSR